MKTVIAIDGPAASGKSSVARKLAAAIDFSYVNSGSFYRVVAWWVLQSGANLDLPGEITRAMERGIFTAGFAHKEAFFHVDGRDVSPFLHEEAINRAVSPVARVDAVRRIVTGHLRSLGADCDVIVEGRDIGSVVFAHTPYKFYVDASPEVRQQRRAAQGQQDVVAERDRVDSSRANAPLVIAPDALVIDSTHLPVDGVVDAILAQLQQRGLSLPPR